MLSQGLCSKALNRAAQSGVMVKGQTLRRDFAQAKNALEAKKGIAKPEATAVAAAKPVEVGRAEAEARIDVVKGKPEVAAAGEPLAERKPVSARLGGVGFAGRTAAGAAAGDAGVDIYSSSANTSRLQDAINTNKKREADARKVLATANAPAEARQQAESDLKEIKDQSVAQKQAVADIIRKLDDKQFIAGFGNNGGEEFLSYMNISETLLAQGGAEWLSWNKSIGENLSRVQNEDGSWAGQHCITGRTFCTGAALLTQMADRAPLPADEPAEPATAKPSDAKAEK